MKIANYKNLLLNSGVDQKRMMIEYDNIMEFAEKNSIDPIAASHKLMDCGERSLNKIFIAGFKTFNDEELPRSTFLPCKTMSCIASASFSSTGKSSVMGLIETKDLMTSRQLCDALDETLSLQDVNFNTCPLLSMKQYNQCFRDYEKL